MKGIILAGGTGTRLGALTRGTNKHLLPLGYEPMVCRAVHALRYDVDDIAIVTGREHMSLFRHQLPLRQWSDVQILSQDGPGGIAHAIEAARGFANHEAVIVLLADNIWERSLYPWRRAFADQGVGARALLHSSRDPDVLHSSGLAIVDHGRIQHVIEKPQAELRGDHLVVTGAYAFDGAVWDILPTLRPSARGELEVTDILNWYSDRNQLEHDVIEGFWCDAGRSVDAYYSAVDFARRSTT